VAAILTSGTTKHKPDITIAAASETIAKFHCPALRDLSVLNRRNAANPTTAEKPSMSSSIEGAMSAMFCLTAPSKDAYENTSKSSALKPFNMAVTPWQGAKRTCFTLAEIPIAKGDVALFLDLGQ
jgi:hypothetical protein